MSATTIDFCADVRRSVKAASVSARAAMLSYPQYERLVALVEACEQACTRGDAAVAARLEGEVVALLADGPACFCSPFCRCVSNRPVSGDR